MILTPFNARQAAAAMMQQPTQSNLSQLPTVVSQDYDSYCADHKIDPDGWRNEDKKDGTRSDNAVRMMPVFGKVKINGEEKSYSGEQSKVFCALEQLNERDLWLEIVVDGEALRGNVRPYRKVTRHRKDEAPAE